MSRRGRASTLAAVLVLGPVLASCGKSERPGEPRTGVAAPAPTPAVAAGPSDSATSSGTADTSGLVLLPDSEPAGAPFASTIAAAVSEVTQGGAPVSGRIYRVAYEQARREIDADNARHELREIERQIDQERQASR